MGRSKRVVVVAVEGEGGAAGFGYEGDSSVRYFVVALAADPDRLPT